VEDAMTDDKRPDKTGWVEGLDWVRVSDILDIDRNDPEVGERIWQALLKNRLGYLPDTDERQPEALLKEARRRITAREMHPDHAKVYLEALRLSAEEDREMASEMQDILRRSLLHVVK
jgi:hypothetical protein